MSKAEQSGRFSREGFRSVRNGVLLIIGGVVLVGCDTNSATGADAYVEAGQLQQAIGNVPSDECADALEEQMTSTGTFDVYGTPACSDIPMSEVQTVADAREAFTSSLPTTYTKNDLIFGMVAMALTAGTSALTVGHILGRTQAEDDCRKR